MVLQGDEIQDFPLPSGEHCPSCGRMLEDFNHCYGCGWDNRDSSDDMPIEVGDEDPPPHSD